jgi:glycosyltransferase involved in cell wall biosynthesis
MLASPSVLLVGLNFAPEPTGIAPYTSFLADTLAAQTELLAFSTFPHYPKWKIDPGFAGKRTVSSLGKGELVRFRPKLPTNSGNLARALLEIDFGYRVVRERWGKRDVAILVSPALFSTAIVLLRIRMFHRRTRVVTWVQDLYSAGLRETQGAVGPQARALAAVEKWVLKNSDEVVVIHERFRALIQREFGVESTIIRNWSHLNFEVTRDPEVTRSQYGWGASPVILHAGNMGVKQGLSQLIDMARDLESKGLRFHLVLVGDGNQRVELERQAEGLRSVQFIPPVPEAELCNLLAAADVLLVNELPSLSEMSVPSKLTTYFRSGKPVLVVSGPDSVAAEEVRSVGSGISVTVGDQSAFWRAVQHLKSPEGLLLGKNGLAYSEQVLSAQAASAAFEQVIQRMMGSRL